MRSIDAKLLKEMFISASNNLYNHYPEVDALNVFPVPDGDTGMNMNLTMASGSKEIQNRNDQDVYSVASTFSKGLLMGARGNSGVITSQIFSGFAKSLVGKNVIKVQDLADAFSNGSKVAYKAVMRPVEGTILTVIRESSEALSNVVEENMSIEKAMETLIKEAKASLKRTPDLLPVLKEVGVVDSGGSGLVHILEGMYKALIGKFVERGEATSVVEEKTAKVADSDEFGYCTEFILRLGPTDEKKPFIENRFKDVLVSRGNSIVVVRDQDIVKVHIHTLNPGQILTYAQGYGEFVTIKVENMTEQHTKLNDSHSNKGEQSKKEPSKDFAMVSISSGKGIDEIFKSLGVDEIVSGGQTMNPSTEDIVEAIRKTDAKNVAVFPNNGNIVMAAVQAKEVLKDEINVEVVMTKTIPEGIFAASIFNPDSTLEDNLNSMKEEISNVKSGSVTYSIKDTSIDGVEVQKDHFMGIAGKKIITCDKNPLVALFKMIETMIDEDSFLLMVLVGEGIENAQVEQVRKELEEKYPEIEIDIRQGDQPVYSFLVGIE